ncbi:MAG: acyl-ACP--UDP-N-acetylglucosamine O-acyltransferase [Alphaproteobacteria bacterium]|nr:acyl-ACP--UDP-N-acetylglucosamine O-acyltransferase [Alphaproteobacteria bacterium]
MPEIHATAIIDPKATIGENVEIGPYCVVGGAVELHDGVRLFSHVVLDGRTVVGEETQIFPFASIGMRPQDLKYQGEESALIIGKKNIIREYVTMNPGTQDGGMKTVVGDNCLFMASSHVAHDCIVGDNVILANNATLAGHVEVGDFAIIGGLAAVHQFARIGRHAIIGGMSGVENNVIPYGSVVGDRARLAGLNIIGLKRRDFSKDDIANLRTAYRMLFAEEGTLAERVDDVAVMFESNTAVMEIVSFMKAESKRGLTQPR